MVTDAEVFGRTPQEIIGGLAEIFETTKGGAVLHILSVGRSWTWAPGAGEIVELLDLAANGRNRRQTEAGRATAAGRGGRPAKLQGKKLAAARADWEARNGSQQEIAHRHGVSVPTLQRLFGSWTARE
jgi:hypothetical protein